MVAEKKECSGSEVVKGKIKTINECANSCKGVASMFAYGTNDFNNNRCNTDGCHCLCENVADADGTCTTSNNSGYRLYRLTGGKYPFSNSSHAQNKTGNMIFGMFAPQTSRHSRFGVRLCCGRK